MSKHVIALAILASILIAQTVSLADEPYTAATAKVQASWVPAERLIQAGHYEEAIVKVQSTLPFLSGIKGKFFRDCVRSAAESRLAMAKAGKRYLTAHPRDAPGARTAADHAWRTFPSMNCP